jgi:hypothetical protein
MGTPVELRSNARQCLKLAGQATRKSDRVMLLDLAEHWLRLASQAHQLQLIASEQDVRVEKSG